MSFANSLSCTKVYITLFMTASYLVMLAFEANDILRPQVLSIDVTSCVYVWNNVNNICKYVTKKVALSFSTKWSSFYIVLVMTFRVNIFRWHSWRMQLQRRTRKLPGCDWLKPAQMVRNVVWHHRGMGLHLQEDFLQGLHGQAEDCQVLKVLELLKKQLLT